MNIYDAYAKKDLDLKNLRIRIKDLEKENKKLKGIICLYKNDEEEYKNKIEELEDEIRSLHNEASYLGFKF